MYNIISTYHFQSKPFCKFLNSAHSDADKISPAVYTARALLRAIDSQRQVSAFSAAEFGLQKKFTLF